MLLLGGACSLLAASAAAEYPFRAPIPEPDLERQPHIELEDAWGDSLPTFRGRSGLYVLAEVGERYAVRIHNPTSERLEAVVSIDGRDAVSGRVADYRRQRGYIVPAYGTVLVEGFRRSLDEVNTFRFSEPARSYSARRGTPENVGVVGAAFFRERTYIRRSQPTLRPQLRSSAKAGSARDEAAASPRGRVNNLGTEYAEARESQVREVSFDRRLGEPTWLVTVRYDDVEGLRARGIDVAPRRVSREDGSPQAFPGSRFAEPPP